jgi:hypothetical protein
METKFGSLDKRDIKKEIYIFRDKILQKDHKRNDEILEELT